MSFVVATATDPGRERERNEDSVLAGSFDDGSWVLIVCDGMGGHDAGDVASQTAARRIYQEVNARLDDPDVPQVLSDALHSSHEEVLEVAASRGSDMGTTAVVARLIGDQLYYAWVGDSRLYLIRDGALAERSLDHTVVQAEIDAGRLDANVDHSEHEDAHVLTQAIGGDMELVPTATHAVQLQPGDTILLCSDGLHDLVTPAETVEFVAQGTPADLVLALVDEANRREGHDNITVALARFEPGAPRSVPKTTPAAPPAPEPVAAGATPAATAPRVPPAPQGRRVTQPDAPLAPKSDRTEPQPEASQSRRIPLLLLVGLLLLAVVGGVVSLVFLVMM